MFHQLVNHSGDLSRLRNEGFEIEIRGKDSPFLLVHNIPYVNQNAEIRHGVLVSELTLGGNQTTTPGRHTIYFIGEYPCNKDGSPITQIMHQSGDQKLAEGLIVNHSFSGRPYEKPSKSYDNYHEKITRYCEVISAPARSLDATVTARTFNLIESQGEESVFNYYDTNSSRAEIDQVSEKLRGHKVGIIGTGGTGAYVLDFVAKTPVAEIHLFDGDIFLQHNAFRAPGAASLDLLREKPKKVDYFQQTYTLMHKHIFAHDLFMNEDGLQLLIGLDFVFICMDQGPAKRSIVSRLEKSNVTFIDVGMGLQLVDNSLMGIIRVTTSTPQQRNHVHRMTRISFDEPEIDEDYRTNIQIAELNALNAALAVIKWKKLLGFYRDAEREHNSTYTISVNMLLSEDHET